MLEKSFEQKQQAQAQLFEQQLAAEKKQMQISLEENLRKTIASDFENQLQLLNSVNKDQEEKLKLARSKEMEFLLKEKEILEKEALTW